MTYLVVDRQTGKMEKLETKEQCIEFVETACLDILESKSYLIAKVEHQLNVEPVTTPKLKITEDGREMQVDARGRLIPTSRAPKTLEVTDA